MGPRGHRLKPDPFACGMRLITKQPIAGMAFSMIDTRTQTFNALKISTASFLLTFPTLIAAYYWLT